MKRLIFLLPLLLNACAIDPGAWDVLAVEKPEQDITAQYIMQCTNDIARGAPINMYRCENGEEVCIARPSSGGLACHFKQWGEVSPQQPPSLEK